VIREIATQENKLSLLPHDKGFLRRKCAACGQHSVAGTKCESCSKGRLQRRASSDQNTKSEAPPIAHDVLKSNGRSLDEGTRALFEPRFGRDFSQVRVHTDSKASESAASVNALAYTVGSNIVFGAHKYEPAGDPGRRLLAHELTHVAQHASSKFNSFGNRLEVGAADSAEERIADQTAAAVLGGQRVQVPAASSANLRRQPDPSKQPDKSDSGTVTVPGPPEAEHPLLQDYGLLPRLSPQPSTVHLQSPSLTGLDLLKDYPALSQRLTTPFTLRRNDPLSPLGLGRRSLLKPPPNLLDAKDLTHSPLTAGSTDPQAGSSPSGLSAGILGDVQPTATLDAGYDFGEGHPVIEFQVGLQADWRAKEFKLGKWGLFDILDQPSAAAVFSFNPKAGLTPDALKITNQFTVSAFNFVVVKEKDRLLEIAPQIGIQPGAGLVGGQITYHPSKHFALVGSGGGQISPRGAISWSAFTLGLQATP